MESKQIMHNQKMGVLDILKKSLLVFGRNNNFNFFTIIASFPMFCFLIYFEFFLQKFLFDTIETLKPSSDHYFNYFWHYISDVTEKMNEENLLQFMQLGFLYLVPLHLLELSTVLAIVDLASKIYKKDKPMSLKDMVQKPFNLARMRGTFITFVYVTLLSACTLLGLLWLVTTYFVILRNTMYYVIFAAICGTSFVPLLGLHLALSAEWNMSVVISATEGIYGPAALALSSFFSVGSHRRGVILMLVFFVWGVVLRLPCLYIGCHKGGYAIVAQSFFLCLGNALKWVACMVYFHDCQKQKSEMKVDGEVGSCG
ncbi:hypothetical protein FNV43_RR26474 [Rhamnella rubrinervis]|uniref:Transmembrane protein n=1 Tax=Rhamnella rubrinervis TaxID=2594499 RepID=A0A8K0DMM8_9ROSA|nr:hypothetical protein FNV43_RR26474 [Rhamnella rubrinervis]